MNELIQLFQLTFGLFIITCGVPSGDVIRSASLVSQVDGTRFVCTIELESQDDDRYLVAGKVFRLEANDELPTFKQR